MIAETGRIDFSRIPVFGDDLDDIKGFVLKTDIFQANGLFKFWQPAAADNLTQTKEAAAEQSTQETDHNRANGRDDPADHAAPAK